MSLKDIVFIIGIVFMVCYTALSWFISYTYKKPAYDRYEEPRAVTIATIILIVVFILYKIF